jgi:mannose/fructose/N-acetylgalactosamine-specific phosphotransferase system component IID
MQGNQDFLAILILVLILLGLGIYMTSREMFPVVIILLAVILGVVTSLICLW